MCESSVSLPSQSEFFSLQFVAFIAHFFTRYDDHPSYLEGFESWFDRAAACMRQAPRKLHRFASKISKNKIKFNLVFSISCKKKNKTQNFSLVPARTDVLLHLPSTFPFVTSQAGNFQNYVVSFYHTLLSQANSVDALFPADCGHVIPFEDFAEHWTLWLL